MTPSSTLRHPPPVAQIHSPARLSRSFEVCMALFGFAASQHHKPKAYLPKPLLPRPDPHHGLSIHNLACLRCARKRTIFITAGIPPGIDRAERRPAQKPNMGISVHHERSRSMSTTPPVQHAGKSNTSSYQMRRSKITLDVNV
jgi:hypothetical protein